MAAGIRIAAPQCPPGRRARRQPAAPLGGLRFDALSDALRERALWLDKLD